MIKIMLTLALCINVQTTYAQVLSPEAEFFETPVVKIQSEYNNYLKDPSAENLQKIKELYIALPEEHRTSFGPQKAIIDMDEALSSFENVISSYGPNTSEEYAKFKSALSNFDEKLKSDVKEDSAIAKKFEYLQGLANLGEEYFVLEKKCTELGATHKTLGECDEGNIKELREKLEIYVESKGSPTKVEVNKEDPVNVTIAPEADSQCSEVLQNLIKAFKGNEALVSKMFNVASIKMALNIANDNTNKVTLEDELKKKMKETTPEQELLSDNLKSLYDKYGKEENLNKLSYYKRDTRLTNQNSSAMIELYLKKSSVRSDIDLTESDAAIVWAMEELRSTKEKSDPNYKIGMPKGNMMNFSSRVYAHLTDFGRSTKRVEKVKIEEKFKNESEALANLLKPILDEVTEEIKQCLANIDEACEIPAQDKGLLEMISGMLTISKVAEKKTVEPTVEPVKKCEDKEEYQVHMVSYAISLKGQSLELCKSDNECKTKAITSLDAAVKACPDSNARTLLESFN